MTAGSTPDRPSMYAMSAPSGAALGATARRPQYRQGHHSRHQSPERRSDAGRRDAGRGHQKRDERRLPLILAADRGGEAIADRGQQGQPRDRRHQLGREREEEGHHGSPEDPDAKADEAEEDRRYLEPA